MTVNRQLSQLVPLPSVSGQFVRDQATNTWVQVTKAMTGLGNASNTADSDKPVSTAQQTALNLKADINAPTLTSPVTVQASAEVRVMLNSPTPANRYFSFYTNGSQRFQFGVSSAAESGSNAGSGFYINKFDDSGNASGNVMTVNRATGETVFWQATRVLSPFQPPQYTLTTLPSASLYSGYEIDVTNATGGSKRCRSNGTVWQILNTTTTVS